MHAYLMTDFTSKTHKRIARGIIRRLAEAFADCVGGKLDYIGMGSLYYEDFLNFYSSGRIDGMTSIEYMLDDEGSFDEQKYRRFMLNRPYDSIRLLPMLVSEALEQLRFDRYFLTWFDYDMPLVRECIEDMAEVIRRAESSGMLALTTGTNVPGSYTSARRVLDMDIVHSQFEDMLTPETAGLFEDLTWENFSPSIREAITPYYQRVVAEKNSLEHKNYRLFNVGRIEYRQPTLFVTDLWLLVDADDVDVAQIEERVLNSGDAGFHRIDMPTLTKREKAIIGSRLDDDPEILADELALDAESVRKYQQYWEDYIG